MLVEPYRYWASERAIQVAFEPADNDTCPRATSLSPPHPPRPTRVNVRPMKLRQERDELFGRIESIAPILAADVDEGDRLRRLPDTTIKALAEAGLLELKVPRALGGNEAEPGLQFDVFERVAMTNACAAWCLFIYADSLGSACARLPDAGVERLLADGFPTVSGGGGLRPGKLVKDSGGFRLTGKFRYGSGIHGAQWVLLTGLADSDDGRPEMRICMVRTEDLDIADTWHTLGMRATGSTDYSANEVFVPEELTCRATAQPPRGGRMFRTGIAGYLGYPIPAVAVGIVQRALDELVGNAASTTRGYGRPTPLVSRATFQNFLGEADMRLQAARAMMRVDGDELMELANQGGPGMRRREAQTRAAGAWAVRTASDVLADIVRYAGGSAMREGTVTERAVRDLAVAAGHLLVSDSAYENHAQFLLELDGADPMA